MHMPLLSECKEIKANGKFLSRFAFEADCTQNKKKTFCRSLLQCNGFRWQMNEQGNKKEN